MSKTNSNILSLIGGTPLVELSNIESKLGVNANIYGKLEYFNPAGSVKDRAAKYMIENAEKRGDIKEDTTIIEPTSGNTGIGLAAIAAVKGYKVILTMPETMSVERKNIMKALGAEIVLTPGDKGMKGAIAKAKELATENKNSFIPLQFSNKDNVLAHKETTGPEIWNDLDGKVDVLIAGIGTGGTITGAGEYLREKNKDIEIIAIEPEGSPVLSEGVSGSHKIQGIGAGFVPEILNTKIYDKIITVKNEDAFEYGKLISNNEGILVGISSGAALYGAVQIAKEGKYKDKNIVVIFPDSGDRYFSTTLFTE